MCGDYIVFLLFIWFNQLTMSDYGDVLVDIKDSRSQGDYRFVLLDYQRDSWRLIDLALTFYRCEVSAEAPSFQTVRDSKQMKVYSK